jgi:hypothetical protein
MGKGSFKMNADLQVSLRLALTLGVPLVLAVLELMTLRHGGWGSRRLPAEPPLPAPRGEGPRRELPACLIPKPQPIEPARREKVLEPA